MSEGDFQSRVRAALEAGVIEADGHTLFTPEHYSPHFSKAELDEAGLIRVHESDGSAKGSIFAADGSLIDKVEAVYNLSFLYWIHGELGIAEYPRAMGRGFQAQELVDMIEGALAVKA